MLLYNQIICFIFQIECTLSSKSNTSNPLTIEAQDSAGEALSVLAKMEGDEDATELAKILTKPWLESLLAAHDKIGALKTISQSNGNDDAQEALLFERLSHYSEPNIKIVRIGKPQFYSLRIYAKKKFQKLDRKFYLIKSCAIQF